MWPAGFEPAPPRVSGERSTGLSYGHLKVGGAGVEPGALLLIREALWPAELPARCELRDKDSNLDSHVQSVASCPLDDPGTFAVAARLRHRDSHCNNSVTVTVTGTRW
jgi:hypothetical protein